MIAQRREMRSLVALATAAIYVARIFSLTLRAGEPAELWWWALWLPLFLWIIAPIVTAYFVRSDAWLFAVGLAAIAAYSLYIYERDMFGPGARSTSALIFLFLPLYQWIAVAVLVGGAWIFRRWAK